MEQLTPGREGLVWDLPWLEGGKPRPEPPKQVDWAGILKHTTGRNHKWQVATSGPLSDIVLRFTLMWPPFDMQRTRDGAEEVGRGALQAHQPNARRDNERVGVFAHGSFPPAFVEPPPKTGYDQNLLRKFHVN